MKVGQLLGMLIGDHGGNAETMTYVGVSVAILALLGFAVESDAQPLGLGSGDPGRVVCAWRELPPVDDPGTNFSAAVVVSCTQPCLVSGRAVDAPILPDGACSPCAKIHQRAPAPVLVLSGSSDLA